MKDVIILGAGIGSRLRPLTDALPKLLVPVAGATILDRALGAVSGRCRSVTLAVGYRAQQIAEAAPEIRLVYNHSYETTNNMHSLYLALASLDLREDVLIMNGDCVYESRVFESALRERSGIFVDRSYPVNAESMKVRALGDHATGISKEITAAEGGTVSIDLYCLTAQQARSLYAIIDGYEEQGVRSRWTEVALNDLLASEPLAIHDISAAAWMEIDNSDDLAQANDRFQL